MAASNALYLSELEYIACSAYGFTNPAFAILARGMHHRSWSMSWVSKAPEHMEKQAKPIQQVIMRKRMISIAALSGASALAFVAQSHAITTVASSDPNALAGAILGGGITINSASYTGAGAAAGTFTGGMAALGIDKGIVLTSGSVANINSANTSTGITTANGLAGWSALDALVPGYTTRDATRLHIDFSTAGGDLFFNYVFGSDEYNEYVGSSFNDVFGFFVDGTAVGNNIATLANGAAVSINNVNLGANAGYYKNNAGPSPWPIEYDGLTTVLQAKIFGLGAGNHTIDLAIADSGDYILDSGVFIEGGSFSDTPKPPGVPDTGATAGMLAAAMIGIGALRRKLNA